jgi:glycine hydroxymethyltransferase
VIAAKAVAFKEALEPGFKVYQQQVLLNAQTMAEVFLSRGYDVVSGGTNDHLFLVSFIEQGLTGKDVDAWLGAANITVNKNAVPNDPQSPFVTSGIRVGTPAITTRGFGNDEARDLAGWMCDLIDARGDQATLDAVKTKVLALCKRFPVYER